MTPPGGLEPPTFRLTAERASQLRHGGFLIKEILKVCVEGFGELHSYTPFPTPTKSVR